MRDLWRKLNFVCGCTNAPQCRPTRMGKVHTKRCCKDRALKLCVHEKAEADSASDYTFMPQIKRDTC
jgi:hypothetical protein